MKTYYLCDCDMGHRWKVFKDDRSKFSDEDRLCSFGHEIITSRKILPSDDVIIKFIPASYVCEYNTSDIQVRGKYYLSISNMQGDIEKISSKSYWWKEATEIAQRFDKRTFTEALKFWDMWKLGDFYSSTA